MNKESNFPLPSQTGSFRPVDLNSGDCLSYIQKSFSKRCELTPFKDLVVLLIIKYSFEH